MPKWRQFLQTKLFTDKFFTDKVKLGTVKVLLLSKPFFIILLNWTVYIIATILLREKLLWKIFIFKNTFLFKISINNRLIMFTFFEQIDLPLDSTRSRSNKIRLNIFISFATYKDICAGRSNVSKDVSDNIADSMCTSVWYAKSVVRIRICIVAILQYFASES